MVKPPFIPYGRQWVDEDDIAAVGAVLRSDWLTTGPAVDAFEDAFAERVGAGHAVALSSGTAALHAAMRALGIGPGDEVIVPALTFAASANCAVYEGARPVFCDIEPGSLVIDPAAATRLISPRTRAIIAVDYAGQPADYGALRALADAHGLALVADGCHALGARLDGVPVGALADITAFSLHPVKHISAGEGGVATTADAALAAHMRRFRNHGIDSDARAREQAGAWDYDMVELGYNYRLSDIHCALAHSQLGRLDGWLERRRAIAARYDAAFSGTLERQTIRPGVEHAYHLYVIHVRRRADVFRRLREAGIGVNVHYKPVHLHRYYRETFATRPGQCPAAEAAYDGLLSLPMFPRLRDDDVERVIKEVFRAIA